jgi:hypothetical protein
MMGTVLATLGLGGHYFIDLVAAFPFGLMIHAGCALHLPCLDRLQTDSGTERRALCLGMDHPASVRAENRVDFSCRPLDADRVHDSFVHGA